MQKQKHQKAANSWRIWLRKKWSNLPTGWVMEISNRVGGARAPHGVDFANPSPSLTSLVLRPIGPIIRRRPRLLPMLHANYILCTDWKVTMIWLDISCEINFVASAVESKVRHIRELTTVITRDSYEKCAIMCYLHYTHNAIKVRQCIWNSPLDHVIHKTWKGCGDRRSIYCLFYLILYFHRLTHVSRNSFYFSWGCRVFFRTSDPSCNVYHTLVVY